jgi:uncharacterized protein (TIGR00288 family)
MPTDLERSLAIFVDFDNIAQGFRRNDRFDIQRVLKRIVEKGKIVAKKTYADWSRYPQYTASLHEAAFELVEIPKRSQTGKNSADIRLCVDAMDLAYAKTHIDTFVIVSGDSDFTPLVSKLKELGKHVIGMGMQGSTSDLLRDNCDEFIYYEDLEVEKAEAPRLDLQVSETKRKALELLLEACLALRRENKEKLWASMIKDTMKRKKPSFNETYHGYRTFSMLLEDAQSQGLVELERDEHRGTYAVTRFGDEMTSGRPRPALREPLSRERGRGRRRMDDAFPAEPAPPGRRERREPREPRQLREPRELREPRVPREPTESTFPEIPEPKSRPRVHDFAEFEQEATAFLGPGRSGPTFDEDFPGFGTPIRPTLGPTSEEVRSKMTFEPRPTPPETEAEPVAAEEVTEPEKPRDEKRPRRRGRGRGRGKGRDETDATPEVEKEAVEEAAPANLEPISFDDVPFVAASEDSAEARQAEPVKFKSHEPEEDDIPVAAPVEQEADEPAPPPQKEAPRGFGFGIFDE